jgi:hypothetical protein
MGRRVVCYWEGSSTLRDEGTCYALRRQQSLIVWCKLGHISPCVTIGALPEDVLLEIFDFCRATKVNDPWAWPRMWQTLVRVCQIWRYVVFASPNRLNLRLLCTDITPVRETLDVWPPLPIEILSDTSNGGDNVIAALEQHDRVCRIWLDLTGSPVERLATVMQDPFPALESLQLWSADETVPVLPQMFLGGSVPRLQSLVLDNIPVPTLPKLLLSSNDLVTLRLRRIPNTGYISPEAMFTGLSTLTRLESLTISFESPASRPDRSRRPPPLTRAVLPALTEFQFQGTSEYLEILVARIDAPLLQHIDIMFFHQLIFDIRQLPHFSVHALMLTSYNRASVIFGGRLVAINLYPPEKKNPPQKLRLGISCRRADWQVSSMAQICSQISFLLSSVKQLDIDDDTFNWESTWQVDMDSTEWLELFDPFTAVRTLRISGKLLSLIVSALQGLSGESATQVLPALDSLCLEESLLSESEQQAVEQFITARQCSDHPVSVHHWAKQVSE